MIYAYIQGQQTEASLAFSRQAVSKWRRGALRSRWSSEGEAPRVRIERAAVLGCFRGVVRKGIVLYCIVLYCIVLYCIVLYDHTIESKSHTHVYIHTYPASY